LSFRDAPTNIESRNLYGSALTALFDANIHADMSSINGGSRTKIVGNEWL
jgi:hypothetical protein